MTDTIKIVEIRILNFRSIKKINVKLEKNTILVGMNNSGKTNFLYALICAIGEIKYNFSKNDIYLEVGETVPPKKRSIVIDILIKPWDYQTNTIKEKFIEDSYWVNLWSSNIVHDDDDNEMCVIRTKFYWDDRKNDYEVDRRFLKEWNINFEDIDNLDDENELTFVPYKLIAPFSLHYINESRDINDDFNNKYSYINKLLSNPGIAQDEINSLEAELSEINRKIIEKSSTLKHLDDQIKEISDILSYRPAQVEVNAVKRNIRDFTKGIDITIKDSDSNYTSISEMGKGTRSIVSIISYYAYLTWKQQNSIHDSYHPFLAIEEPENHLHPQSQRKILNHLSSLAGQLIISTHSPFVTEFFDLKDLRFFIRENNRTEVLKLETFENSDLRKVKHWIIKTRGYLLFANAIILVSGDTEEMALPIFAKEYWGLKWYNLEIEIINVEGDGNYYPFLKIADNLKINYYIFSDGEQIAIRDVDRSLNKAGLNDSANNDHVVIIPNGKDFEELFLTSNYKQPLIDMVISETAINNHHKKALQQEWQQETNPFKKLNDVFDKEKPLWGQNIANTIVNLPNKNLRFPDVIKSLFDKISEDLQVKGNY